MLHWTLTSGCSKSLGHVLEPKCRNLRRSLHKFDEFSLAQGQMLRHRSLFWVLGGVALNVALRPSPPGYAGYAPARPAVTTPAAPYKVTPAAKPQPKTPMPVFVGSLEDWLRPEAKSYQALHFPRSPSWPNYQMEIDRSLADFGPESQLETKIEREPGKELGFKQLCSHGFCWDFVGADVVAMLLV